MKLNIRLSYDPTIKLLAIYPEMEKRGSQKTCTRMIIATLFGITNNRK